MPGFTFIGRFVPVPLDGVYITLACTYANALQLCGHVCWQNLGVIRPGNKAKSSGPTKQGVVAKSQIHHCSLCRAHGEVNASHRKKSDECPWLQCRCTHKKAHAKCKCMCRTIDPHKDAPAAPQPTLPVPVLVPGVAPQQPIVPVLPAASGRPGLAVVIPGHPGVVVVPVPNVASHQAAVMVVPRN